MSEEEEGRRADRYGFKDECEPRRERESRFCDDDDDDDDVLITDNWVG